MTAPQILTDLLEKTDPDAFHPVDACLTQQLAGTRAFDGVCHILAHRYGEECRDGVVQLFYRSASLHAGRRGHARACEMAESIFGGTA